MRRPSRTRPKAYIRRLALRATTWSGTRIPGAATWAGSIRRPARSRNGRPQRAQIPPYAIEVIDDIIWYNESEQRPDALVRFDPKTEKFQSWAIPSGIGIIRHMRATPEGNLVIHQSSTNTVGLVIIAKQDNPRPTSANRD
jgi:streptogramin lyase